MQHHRLVLPEPPADLAGRAAAGDAIIWQQPVRMHTYEPAEPDRFPMFLDRRVYQGSSGRVYPLPFIDRIATDGAARSWRAVHLENRWIRLMVLPELGGRIHVAFDKVAGYDFFYRNNVIKPALVGLAGPWISGGVELNWPQHHRPATFLPVEVEIEDADGAVTVWCSDHDPFTRMKGMHGIRLYRDRALVELVVRLHNRTSLPQTFLWWANVAAAVHDEYQSFFPTDVHYVADHARRAITAFPAADRPYYGVDYPARSEAGGDRLDFYRNIPVPTSYMVTDSVDDFFGGYDHRARAGFIHVADHHIAPGKKQWTWGNAPFGHAWDRQLTETDGPYIELMAGVYTDNQPDFAWLEPGETKTFTQTWYPIQEIGPAHQANEDAAVRLDVVDGALRVGLCVTAERPGTTVQISVAGRLTTERRADLEPGKPLLLNVPAHGATAEAVEVLVVQEGTEIVRWRPRPVSRGAEPWVAAAPPSPSQVQTVEELYLAGLHLSQYRHPTRSPLRYWEEALVRDPGHAPTHLAMADDRLRRADYEGAERHARAALKRLNVHNANPRDGEASYLLGLALMRQSETRAAVDALAKAAWDVRWSGPAHVELSRLDARVGRWDRALTRAMAALHATPGDSRAETVRFVALRSSGRLAEAELALRAWLARDPLDQIALELAGDLRTNDGRTLLDVAAELSNAGDAAGALRVLAQAEAAPPTAAGEIRPLAAYRRAQLLDTLGHGAEAARARRRARELDATRCFPAGLDDHDALRAALAADPDDDRAAALLGMLLYDAGRQREALELWTWAIDQGRADPVTLRNAAIALVNLEGDDEGALVLYERAIAGDSTARLLYERDQLLARTGAPAGRRLDLLNEHRSEALRRDDLATSFCRLLVEADRAIEALAILESRQFAPWEGGEGQVIAAWEAATMALAAAAESRGDLRGAANFLRRAITTPENLGEARHPLTDTQHLHHELARLLDLLGRSDEATEARAAAVISPSGPVAASVDDDEVDYFATSLPDLLLFRRPARARIG
jgi:tetratricopeptide (TPR) repeat protein